MQVSVFCPHRQPSTFDCIDSSKHLNASLWFFTRRPLHLAARNGLATVVQALLSRGATVLAVDEEGKSHRSAASSSPALFLFFLCVGGWDLGMGVR